MDLEKKSWQCDGCKKWKAPHVDECDCVADALPPMQPTVIPSPVVIPTPVYPYDPSPWPRPPWESPFTFTGTPSKNETEFRVIS